MQIHQEIDHLAHIKDNAVFFQGQLGLKVIFEIAANNERNEKYLFLIAIEAIAGRY